MRLGADRGAVHLDGSTSQPLGLNVTLYAESFERFVARYDADTLAYVLAIALRVDTVVDGRLQCAVSDQVIAELLGMGRHKVGRIRQTLEADGFISTQDTKNERGRFVGRVLVLDPERLAQVLAEPDGAEPANGQETPGHTVGAKPASRHPAGGRTAGGNRASGRETAGHTGGTERSSGSSVVAVVDEPQQQGEGSSLVAQLEQLGFVGASKWLTDKDPDLVRSAIERSDSPNVGRRPAWIRWFVEQGHRLEATQSTRSAPAPTPQPVASRGPSEGPDGWPPVDDTQRAAVEAAIAALPGDEQDRIEQLVSRRRRPRLESNRLREWEQLILRSELIGVPVPVPVAVLEALGGPSETSHPPVAFTP